ncbi:Glycine/D-amino acid oxidase [Tranquillimonas rosea]|uniref:Glycine/D-amino acid oxidase n=1 Tax=Tranquillimonas rosea TaxID=641238 RepID=A0A1H9W6A7_9RHOB|nr:FAD-binding oxidoreductase [Tranquillimonas rosea]SES29003.1 Glycine/D-amino acid oxidase [Tranquillimonas rosea]
MATRDVTVRGAGIFGLSVAWACLSRGASVRVIDPHGPGAGASGGIVGALAPHTPERWNPKKAFQFDSLIAAEGFWRGVAETGGRDPGYARSGRVQPLADLRAVDLARDRADQAADLWQGRATWCVVPVHDTGWTVTSATGLAVHDTLTARLHPAQATAALAAAITAAGGEIATKGRDEGRVVWATGATGLRDLSAALGQDVGVAVKGQAALLGLSCPDRPQLFADGLHIVPHADGTVAIGSTSERDFTDPAATDTALDDVLARARAAAPDLAAAPVLRRWAGLRPRARSRAPMLGPWPGRPGHYVANGGFKIGFGMAPKVAEVLADLLLEGRDSIPADFRVEASLR